MAQNYTTKSNLFLQFGTDKALPELFGDYVMFGPNRMIEGIIDLTKLTTTAAIQSNTTFFPAMPASPAGLYIEKVELIAEVASTTSSSATFSLGLIQVDRATVPSGYGTGLISALANSTFSTAATITTVVGGSTGAGSLIGTGPSSTTGPYYITAATGTGTFTAGTLRVRIFYHPLNVLTTVANISQ